MSAQKASRRLCRTPGCGQRIGSGKAFCGVHWRELPGAERHALYGRIHPQATEAVEQLIARAVATLDRSERLAS